MMDIQAILDHMMTAHTKERSETQMTLMEMVHILEKYPPEMKVVGVSAECDSYRGYYSDLAFEPGTCLVGELHKRTLMAIGETFEGYKGGDFTMTKITPVFVASYGSCGDKMMDFEVVAGDDGVEYLQAATEEETF